MEPQAHWADGARVQIHGAPRRAGVTAGASALQGADDTSSSEGSTVDCLDPEEILRKIPELADNLDEPDDCFTEGIVAATGLLPLTFIRARIQLIWTLLCSGLQPGVHGRQASRIFCSLLSGLRAQHQTRMPDSQKSSSGICISHHIRHSKQMLCLPHHL